MRFRSIVELGGKTATGVRVPPEVVTALAAGKRPAVRVTINSHTYRSTVAAYGGGYFLPLSAENRDLAGVSAGHEVDVDVVLDTEARVVEVPPDLAVELAVDPSARDQFARLSYSSQRRYVLSVEGAKTARTRERRIAKVLAELRAEAPQHND